MVGYAGDATFFAPGKEVRTVSFPIENQGKPVQKRIFFELLFRGLARNIPEQSRNCSCRLLAKYEQEIRAADSRSLGLPRCPLGGGDWGNPPPLFSYEWLQNMRLLHLTAIVGKPESGERHA
jgi:hypothetical protein